MKNIEILKKSNSDLYLARHITIDYYECDTNVLLNKELLEKILIDSAKSIWATIISSHFHNFEPQWVSWVVILSESHFTIHSWPEYNYVAIDMFACWDMQFEKGMKLLSKAFKTKKINIIDDNKRWLIINNNLLFPKRINKKILEENNNNWKKSFEENNAWWIASSIDIYWCNPKLIRNTDVIKEYVNKLCKLIEMKTFWKTNVVHFGEDEKVAWFSMTQLIETSLISGHFANASNTAYIDIFSCKYYSPSIVANFTIDFFKWEYFKLNVNMRDEK